MKSPFGLWMFYGIIRRKTKRSKTRNFAWAKNRGKRELGRSENLKKFWSGTLFETEVLERNFYGVEMRTEMLC